LISGSSAINIPTFLANDSVMLGNTQIGAAQQRPNSCAVISRRGSLASSPNGIVQNSITGSDFSSGIFGGRLSYQTTSVFGCYGLLKLQELAASIA
jgi:hypothetical protein